MKIQELHHKINRGLIDVTYNRNRMELL